MTATAILLMVSGALIGAGVTIFIRDLQRGRRRAFVVRRDGGEAAGPEPEAEITITRPESVRVREPVPLPTHIVSPAVPPPAAPAATAPATLEQQWAALQPALSVAAERVNAELAPLSLGAPGEPTWSYKHRGYGGYRRVMLGRESIAWLRLEVSADGRLHASVKAHKEDKAAVNATADAPLEGLGAAGAGDLLLRCLAPAVARFAQRPASAQGGEEGDEAASEQAWRSIDALVASSLKATNGALGQAGASLVPIGPAAWDPELCRHRLTLKVEVNGNDVARMHIERLQSEMEVAVGVRDAELADLGRRRRLPVEGMTIHALAELIAGCAWPAIARHREVSRVT